jgi:hypothetical protein
MKMHKINIYIKGVFVLCSLFFSLALQSQELESYIEDALTNSPEIQ